MPGYMFNIAVPTHTQLECSARDMATQGELVIQTRHVKKPGDEAKLLHVALYFAD